MFLYWDSKVLAISLQSLGLEQFSIHNTHTVVGDDTIESE